MLYCSTDYLSNGFVVRCYHSAPLLFLILILVLGMVGGVDERQVIERVQGLVLTTYKGGASENSGVVWRWCSLGGALLTFGFGREASPNLPCAIAGGRVKIWCSLGGSLLTFALDLVREA